MALFFLLADFGRAYDLNVICLDAGCKGKLPKKGSDKAGSRPKSKHAHLIS